MYWPKDNASSSKCAIHTEKQSPPAAECEEQRDHVAVELLRVMSTLTGRLLLTQEFAILLLVCVPSSNGFVAVYLALHGAFLVTLLTAPRSLLVRDAAAVQTLAERPLGAHHTAAPALVENRTRRR